MEFICFQYRDATHPVMMRSLKELWDKLEQQLQDPDLTPDQVAYYRLQQWAMEREAYYLKSVH